LIPFASFSERHFKGQTMKTKSQEIAADVSALVRARNPLIWIVTREEARVEGYLIEAAGASGYTPRTWDVAQGFRKMDGTADANVRADTQDAGDALAEIESRAVGTSSYRNRGMWIMRDLPVWLGGPIGATTLRRLRNLVRSLPRAERPRAQSIVVLSTSAEVPAELAAHATVIEWPLPDRAEVEAILDAAINVLPEFETNPETNEPDETKPLRSLAAPNGTRDAAIDAAVGLSGEEAAACYAKSLVQFRRIDPVAVAQEKKRVIARERVLEWYDPMPGGLDAVGGLENLKAWLTTRKLAYSPAARAYGLPSPKGAMLVGVPGCGKSLTAKAIATAWGVPLLKIDLGALKGKFVGESEGNLRKAFRVVEAIGRCVVWFDEIEKAMAGATQGAADGGVSADALGAVLNWMQERKTEAFVIATANDVEALPPELLRKGRFDEVWFVDLPTLMERAQILDAALRSFGRDPELDRRAIAEACNDFTGSEIAAIVPDAMFAAFADGAREIRTDDLLRAAKDVIPLAKTAETKIARLRKFADDGRARRATKPETEAANLTEGRNIEF
jgi:MoxR-like ATPase